MLGAENCAPAVFVSLLALPADAMSATCGRHRLLASARKASALSVNVLADRYSLSCNLAEAMASDKLKSSAYATPDHTKVSPNTSRLKRIIPTVRFGILMFLTTE